MLGSGVIVAIGGGLCPLIIYDNSCELLQIINGHNPPTNDTIIQSINQRINEPPTHLLLIEIPLDILLPPPIATLLPPPSPSPLTHIPLPTTIPSFVWAPSPNHLDTPPTTLFPPRPLLPIPLLLTTDNQLLRHTIIHHHHCPPLPLPSTTKPHRQIITWSTTSSSTNIPTKSSSSSLPSSSSPSTPPSFSPQPLAIVSGGSGGTGGNPCPIRGRTVLYISPSEKFYTSYQSPPSSISSSTALSTSQLYIWQ